MANGNFVFHCCRRERNKSKVMWFIIYLFWEWQYSHKSGDIEEINYKYIVFIYIFVISIGFIKASRGAAARGKTVKPTGCGFDPDSRRWNIYFNIFPFLRSGVEVKCGVEFCHSTRNASRIWQKAGTGVSENGSLCLLCNVRDTAWSWFNFDFKYKFYH